ncbi:MULTISPECIES: hypothetical protein [unclassified Devosia]|jgi:hypothetical protein|uniref:hypothetical protein n=1 Tax=unclassified Devosia TaxID=196773 RepID=UPI001ACC84FC|nr:MULTISPECIES: hypothetical protein [unclassified Devosia]MBN9305984.1 hypothetical protein [Devosia sp.]
MQLIRLVAGELFGLFVDDEFLAIAILVVVAITGVLSVWTSVPKGLVGTLLLAGCLTVVAMSLARTLRR